MKRFTDLSWERLREIYEVVKSEHPVLVEKLQKDEFDSSEEKASVISGITFFIGSEILKDQNPLSSEAGNISYDICFFIIMGMEPGS